MTSCISYAALDRLTADVLPERTLLSSVVTPIVRSGRGAPPPMPLTTTSPDGGTTIGYSCQYTQYPGPPALLAALGLGSTSPGYTMSCMPAAMSTHY